MAPSLARRAVGVVRVSHVGKRTGERFVSPSEQRERIETACARDGLELGDVFEELDVSGGADLARRPGLSRAVALVEAGKADVVVVAYFDRLVRSLSVQRELLERVELAGGAILAVDIGEVRADTASRWLSSTMMGMVAEYHRRVTAERTAEAKRRAIERGVPPFPNTPPGYRKRDDGTLKPDAKEAKVVAEAFRLRAEGATVMEVREHLREHGIKRSFHGTTSLLGSRIVLGELRFGEMVNTDSHPAIVDAGLWQRVQRMSSPRGRRAKSERLLARLGVLRCGTCGARMVVGTANHGAYSLYRCPPNADCERRVTISAEFAERVVVEAVQELLADVHGSASVEGGAEDAARQLESRQEALDKAIRAFEGLEGEDAARERLQELREARDRARERYEDLAAAASPAITVSAGDWDVLTIDEQRALIRAVVDRAVVRPGRGPDRITVEPLG
jgi:DNA invertase Pin-like site-specific DNA recombinase/exonuclease VII small subunit